MELQQTNSTVVTKEKVEIRSTIILIMCSLYLVHFFVSIDYLTYFLAGLTTIVFVSSLPNARFFPRLFSIGMFSTGVIVTVSKGNGITYIADGVLMNLPLLTLVILVPLISIPFKIGGYFQSIHYYLEKISHQSKKMFASISIFLFCFGPILNLGSIRVIHEMVSDLKLNRVMLAKAYLVGFSTVILWSPYFASVALVLYYLDLAVLDYIFYGLGLAIFQLFIGNLLFWIYLKNMGGDIEQYNSEQLDLNTNEPSNQNHMKKMVSLTSILVLLMAMIFSLEYITKWPMMYLVSLISIVFPVLWITIFRKWRDAKLLFEGFKSDSVPKMSNEIAMFISAGVFATSLTGTNFAFGINHFLNNIASFSFLLFCLTVVLIIITLSYVGVHQIVVVTVLAIQMDPIVIGTSANVLALLFMLSWSISGALSPTNPFNLLVSSSVGKSGVVIGLRWNGLYVLTMFVFGILLVLLIH